VAPFDRGGANANAGKNRQSEGSGFDIFRPAIMPRPAPAAQQVPRAQQAPAGRGPRHRKTRAATSAVKSQTAAPADKPRVTAPAYRPHAAALVHQPSTVIPAETPAAAALRQASPGRPQRQAGPQNPATHPQDQGLVLPVPPLDTEKYSYVRRHNWILTVCQLLTFPPLLYSQFRLFEDSPWFLVYAPFVLIGLLTFLLSLLSDGMGRDFDLDEHKKLVSVWMPLWYPTVDVFLPVCGEPIDLLRNTWTHVAALRAAYNGKLTPYVLDDGANPEAKALARELGFAYATRPDRGWYKKSGNLRYGFEISNGEYILLLDADFAPRTDLLDETLPYFDVFPDVGIVQTPQFFHVVDEQTWIERGGGATQELFYRSIQSTRARKGAAICVGSCAVYRRAALEPNGGMSLAEHSEDLHTGFDLYQLGWKLRYLPIALSTGNCPDNILAFLNQQYRWCSGTFSLLRGSKFWRSPLPLYTRLCYLAGSTYYVYTAVFTFVGPILAISMLLLAPQLLGLKNMIFVAPVLVYAGVIYPMWHRAPYRLESWAVRMLSGWAHAFALSDMMCGRLRGWQPSGSGSKRQDGRRRLWMGLIGWSFGSAALWVLLALLRMMTMNPYDFYFPLALGVFQLAVVGRILLQPTGGAS
jgi:cellulose synthase (UDP-forming)